ncbi:hypothetical protein [Roseivirga thermotolerans]|uniref:hypothetical protein n=1 Tax=Roseivirga thermotolerans TaxID=1758176 RepID=UPI00273D3E57|nr:hypothetical protein [Roseivirga thermotolerans]
MKKKIIKSGISRERLAQIYKVDPDTIREWLRDIGVTQSKTLKPSETAQLIRTCGVPDTECEIR